jgi:hypothetical protein
MLTSVNIGYKKAGRYAPARLAAMSDRQQGDRWSWLLLGARWIGDRRAITKALEIIKQRLDGVYSWISSVSIFDFHQRPVWNSGINSDALQLFV